MDGRIEIDETFDELVDLARVAQQPASPPKQEQKNASPPEQEQKNAPPPEQEIPPAC